MGDAELIGYSREQLEQMTYVMAELKGELRFCKCGDVSSEWESHLCPLTLPVPQAVREEELVVEVELDALAYHDYEEAKKPLYTFEPTFPDGSPRRSVGSWRPPYADARQAALANGPGVYFYAHEEYSGKIVQDWQLGHFDRPLYAVEPSE